MLALRSLVGEESSGHPAYWHHDLLRIRWIQYALLPWQVHLVDLVLFDLVILYIVVYSTETLFWFYGMRFPIELRSIMDWVIGSFTHWMTNHFDSFSFIRWDLNYVLWPLSWYQLFWTLPGISSTTWSMHWYAFGFIVIPLCWTDLSCQAFWWLLGSLALNCLVKSFHVQTWVCLGIMW